MGKSESGDQNKRPDFGRGYGSNPGPGRGYGYGHGPGMGWGRGWRARMEGHFRSRGYRFTVPRQVILEILEENEDYVSAEDLYIQVHERHPGIGLATVRKLAKTVDVLGVSERTFTFGYGGPFFAEVGGAIYNSVEGDERPILKNYMLGVGGRDVRKEHIIDIFNNMLKIKGQGKLDQEIFWYGLKDAYNPDSEGGF